MRLKTAVSATIRAPVPAAGPVPRQTDDRYQGARGLVEKGCENISTTSAPFTAGINPVASLVPHKHQSRDRRRAGREAAHASPSRALAQGNDGALEFADAVKNACNDKSEFKFLYELGLLRAPRRSHQKQVPARTAWPPPGGALKDRGSVLSQVGFHGRTHLSLTHESRGTGAGRSPSRYLIRWQLRRPSGAISLMPAPAPPTYLKVDVDVETGKVRGLL